MSAELINILESIAREKGIDREILIKAIEGSLVSAARKSSEPIAQKKNIFVNIDREKGTIKAFAELIVVENTQKPTTDEIILSEAKKLKSDINVGEPINVDITPHDFGRIAAQSAKQIIIQKIREAERGVVLDEYKERIGDIVMGTVRRKEKGSIVVDLGKTEALLPIKEQCPEERYHLGERVRAYIAEVKSSQKGAEITLSRTHPGFIRRLFEIEVPEILEGSVEIKGIVREPGFRCKVAVSSTDSKIDPVGACVGMRGSRIKNIVRELGNEKLDIIKWEKDIIKYAANALSPAEINKVTLNEAEKKLEILVNEEELSIAIGKRGQNVRLASRLIGWEIDIRKVGGEIVPIAPEAETTGTVEVSGEISPNPAPTEADTEKPAEEHQSTGTDIASSLDISQKKYEALASIGLDSLEKIANAEVAQLTSLEGFGEKTAEKIKEKAKELLQQSFSETNTKNTESN